MAHPCCPTQVSHLKALEASRGVIARTPFWPPTWACESAAHRERALQRHISNLLAAASRGAGAMALGALHEVGTLDIVTADTHLQQLLDNNESLVSASTSLPPSPDL